MAKLFDVSGQNLFYKGIVSDLAQAIEKFGYKDIKRIVDIFNKLYKICPPSEAIDIIMMILKFAERRVLQPPFIQEIETPIKGLTIFILPIFDSSKKVINSLYLLFYPKEELQFRNNKNNREGASQRMHRIFKV